MLKRNIKFSVAFAIFLIFSNAMAADEPETKQTPSFDCSKAKTKLEKSICSYSYLSYLDKRMAFYFQEAKKSLPDKEKQSLLQDQRMWLSERSKRCTDSLCLVDLYRDRNWQLLQKTIKPNGQPPIVIVSNLEFGDLRVSGLLTQDDVSRLSNFTINGHGQYIDGLQLTTSDEKIAIHNCKEYWKYGLDVQNSYDMAMASFFMNTCDSLKFIQHINKPLHDEKNIPLIEYIQKLPASYISSGSVQDEDKEMLGYKDKGYLVGELINKDIVKLKKKTNLEVVISCELEGLEQYFTEIARGDFLGKGYNQILITEGEHAISGTYSNHDACVLNMEGNKVSCDSLVEKSE